MPMHPPNETSIDASRVAPFEVPTRSSRLPAMLDEITRYYGKPRAAVVIPIGRDAHQFRIGSKQPYVLGIGRVWDESEELHDVGYGRR